MPSVRRIIKRRTARKKTAPDRLLSVSKGLAYLPLAILAIFTITILISLSWRADFLDHQRTSINALSYDLSTGQTPHLRFFDHTGETLLYDLTLAQDDQRQWLDLESFPRVLQDAVSVLLTKELERLPNQAFVNVLHPEKRPTFALAWQIADSQLSVNENSAQIPGIAFKQWVLSDQLVREFDHNYLMTWYLNTAYCGNGTLGMQAAARAYFDLSLREISPLEASALAVASLRPEVNPAEQRGESLQLAQSVLRILVEEDLLSEAAASYAIERGYSAGMKGIFEEETPFIQLAREQAEAIIPPELLYREGFDITTSYDNEVNLIVSELADELAIPSPSIAIFDSQRGELLGLISEDRNARADRSITPLIQPFVALTALSQGYTLASPVLDSQWALPPEWEADQSLPAIPASQELLSIRDSLAAGRIIPTLQIASWVGEYAMLRTGEALGLPFSSSRDMLIEAANPVQAAYDLTALASGGSLKGFENATTHSLQPLLIIKITDAGGEISWEYPRESSSNRRQIFDPAAVYLVNDTLRRADIPAFDLAMLIGESMDGMTFWAGGYSGLYTAALWADSPSSGQDEQIFALLTSMMEALHQGKSLPRWEKPDSITSLSVCQYSGQLPTPYCPVIDELFIAGTEPSNLDTMYQPIQINRENGLLATVYTPADLVEEKVYQIFPIEYAHWVAEAGIPQPPTEYDLVNLPAINGNLLISYPDAFSYVKGLITIIGTVRDEDFKQYRIDYGMGLNPQEWLQIGEAGYDEKIDETLLQWDTTGLNGLVILRLTLVRTDNSIEKFLTQITIDNTPPTAEITAILPSTRASVYGNTYSIEAYAQDTIGIAYVEFLLDQHVIQRDETPPYEIEITPETGSSHQLQIAAYDLAGNVTLSERVLLQASP